MQISNVFLFCLISSGYSINLNRSLCIFQTHFSLLRTELFFASLLATLRISKTICIILQYQTSNKNINKQYQTSNKNINKLSTNTEYIENLCVKQKIGKEWILLMF